MKSTQQLITRKAWLETQHRQVCAELRARGVELEQPQQQNEPATPAKPRRRKSASKKPAAKD